MMCCDNFYHPEADGGISILDETLGIDWKIPTEHRDPSQGMTGEELHAYRNDGEYTIDNLAAERAILKDSLLRIMASVATVPQTLRDDVVDELENQL